MPVVVNNNFSQDTYGMRTERLIAIQGNFASIQPELSAPANISTWAADCFDVYANLLALSGLEMTESEVATAIVAEKVAALEEAYQNVKYIGTSIYTDRTSILDKYEFGTSFPDNRDDMFRRVDAVILAYNRHTADGVTPLIPETLITRLTGARDDVKTALATQDDERYDARNAVTVASERFVEDTKKLNELKSWTYVMLGKQDDRVNLIGMVNPSTGGNNGPIPGAPTNLTVNIETMVFSWDAVEENITSYQLMASVAGIEWVEIYSGPDNFVYFIPTSENYQQYKVRGRNENGFGNYSLLMLYNHQAFPAPEDVSVAITSVPLGTIELTWSAVPLAQSYKIFYAKVDFGLAAPALTAFLNAGTVTVTSFEGTSEVGKRQYYFVRSVRLDGEIVSEPSAVVFVER